MQRSFSPFYAAHPHQYIPLCLHSFIHSTTLAIVHPPCRPPGCAKMPSVVDVHRIYGPWAVVSGASSGIGAAFASHLASLGFSLLLVARRAALLNELRDNLLASHPQISIELLPLDLTATTTISTTGAGGDIEADKISEEPMEVLARVVDKLDVGLVVNNAGVELPGAFLTHTLSQHDSLLALNVIAHARIAHILGTALAKRCLPSPTGSGTKTKRGGMISISSFTARPLPYNASYSASKAFVSTLGLSLAEEWRPLGIDVTVVEPGFVDTEMVARVRESFHPESMGFSVMKADVVAKMAVAAFARRKRQFVPGLRNKFVIFMFSIVPIEWATSMSAFLSRTKMDKKLIEFKTD